MKDPKLTKPENAPVIGILDLKQNPYWQTFTFEVPKSEMTSQQIFSPSDINPESVFDLKDLLKKVIKADAFN